MTESEIVMKKEFESMKNDIIKLYDSKGMRASGRFAKSLKVDIRSDETSSTGVLIGNKYADQLEDGRLPTTGPAGSPTLFEQIIEWIQDKGIRPIEKKMKISTLAFLITRKIHREGWKREKHGGVDLISSIITPERVQSIINKLTVVNIAKITSELTNFYKELQPVN